MKNIKYIVVCLISAITLLGCKEDLLDENPPNVIYAEELYGNLEGLEAGVNGLQSLMRYEREGVDGGSNLITDMTMGGTDTMVPNHGGRGVSSMSVNWASASPDNGFLSDIFLWLYEIVNSANEIIQNVENRNDIDWQGQDPEDSRNYILAEARFARAFAYRHLTYLWGDVPLNLEPSSNGVIRTDWERTSVDMVREQIIRDLRFAEHYTPVEASLRGRQTKGAVQHYLAEMYLAQERPDSALYFANQVVNNSAYNLVTNRYGVSAGNPGNAFMDMFKAGNTNREEGNSEALWVFQFERGVLGGGTYPIMAMHLTSRYRSGDLDLIVTGDRGGYGNGRLAPTKWAFDNYDDPNDDRFSIYAIRKQFQLRTAEENDGWGADPLPEGMNYGDIIYLDWSVDISPGNTNREEWPFSRKYDWADPVDPMNNRESWYDQIYLRAADTYLLKAEAEFKLGNNSAAATTINMLRTRANATLISAAAITLDFILDERARELLSEGPRRYTLLRTHKWAERTALYNHNGGQTIDPVKDVLLPIPQSVIDANLTKSMEQNPGY